MNKLIRLVAGVFVYVVLAAPVVGQDADRFTVTWGPEIFRQHIGPSMAKGSGSGIYIFPVGLGVDAYARNGTVSDSNGVLEPGEFVVVETTWGGYSYPSGGGSAHNVSGTLSSFVGPAGGGYSLGDASAYYGDIHDLGYKSCNDGSADACYTISVTSAGARPATHWDGIVQETLNLGGSQPWKVHIGESFADVPRSDPFYKFVETLLHNGVTAGCAAGAFCPDKAVTREQVAVLLLKAREGSAYAPRVCTRAVFTDVSCARVIDAWIEDLFFHGITGGCGGGLYCPGKAVTRQQMAVLLLKTLEGRTYVPPECTGAFTDVPCTPGTGFGDWIEELVRRGISEGCSATPALFCPTSPVTRGEMSALLTKTFRLVLYGPY